MSRAPESIFTLRGHKVGVTALIQWHVNTLETYLISGDEEGTILIWSLKTFRKLTNLEKICCSRVQSLRVIKLRIGRDDSDILIAQSRDNGVHLFLLDRSKFSARLLKTFSTYESLFSRGDARSIDPFRGILAYPSEIGGHLVTIRYLGDDAVTLRSGSAKRNDDITQSRSNIFDIVIREHQDEGKYWIYVAYEDGCICTFTSCFESVEEVPVLHCIGLKIDLTHKFDLNIKDFVSAFDVISGKERSTIILGSPSNELIFIDVPLAGSEKESSVQRVKLKRRGVSAIATNPSFVIVACWDNSVKIYSTDREYVATLETHTKQVHDILFVKATDLDSTNYNLADDDRPRDNVDSNPNSYLFCCASIEGTISISSIY